LNEKPRSASSICGDDTPKSRVMPLTRTMCSPASKTSIAPNGPCKSVNRGLNSATIFCPASMASGSRSISDDLRFGGCQQSPAIPAASESPIHINAPVARRERLDNLAQASREYVRKQERSFCSPVPGLRNGGDNLAKRNIFSASFAPRGVFMRGEFLRVPDLERFAPPDESDFFGNADSCNQVLRQADAPFAVERQLHRTAENRPFRSTRKHRGRGLAFRALAQQLQMCNRAPFESLIL